MLSIEQRIDRYSSYDQSTGCTLWSGALANGRPCLRINKKTTKVTRLLLAKKLNRDLLPSEHALHDCDNPICVNADHLHVGSHADNMREMWERRPPKRRGEGVGRAKLTIQQVIAIRSSSEPQRALAKQYGVAPSTISVIRHRHTWPDVA